MIDYHRIARKHESKNERLHDISRGIRLFFWFYCYFNGKDLVYDGNIGFAVT